MLKRITVAAIAAALIAVPALAAQKEANPRLSPVIPRGCHSATTTAGFASFAERVWDEDRWRRGKPKAKTLRAMRQQRRCVLRDRHRKTMKKKWKVEKRAFYRHREKKLEYRRYLVAITPPGAAYLADLRSCESGGDYSINTGNGFYGAYQFTLSTWASVGGSGYPHYASAREQDERAAYLWRTGGPEHWPNCG